MTREERRTLVANLIRLGVFGVALYFSLPGDARPPLRIHAWRAGAIGAQLVADQLDTFALYCRSRYWRAVQS